MLARRGHSEAELRQKLAAKGFSSGAIDEIVRRLTGLGYLDDARFAQQWAESAVRNCKGYGTRLRLELQRRGIAVEIIERVLAEIATDHAEPAMVKALLAWKFADFAFHQATPREQRRVLQYLQRRGFSTAVIFQIFNGTERE